MSKKLSKQINRTVAYSSDSKQINVLDTRFYRRNKEYYPSVSSILQYYPKGKFFEDWIKGNGFNSDVIAAKAANEGTQTHNAIEEFLAGKEIEWLDERGNTKYPLDVWRMILKFAEFWNTYKPELIQKEYHVFSDKHKFAGTIDLVIKLFDKLWLIDIKTSNSLHTINNLQLASYAIAWNETHDTPIEETGILWLKSSARSEKKNDRKIQGRGWELRTIGDIEQNFKIFQNVYEIFKIENPYQKPMTENIPVSVKMEI